VPLIGRQKRAAEIGIIRIGTSRPVEGKRGRQPVKLDRFRFTSRSETAVRAIAAMYGGQAREWVDGAPTAGQWEVITNVSEIPVAVPPGALVLDAWYELWNGGVRERKCDGVSEHLSGGPCQCDPERRTCRPYSRLRVILPDVPGGGTWRLNTQGENAADELAGVAETMALYAERGQVLPAVLRLEQRKTVTAEGTRRYVVPVLQLTQTVRELTSLPEGRIELPPAPVAAIGAGSPAPTSDALPAEPGSPQEMAQAAEECADGQDLSQRLGRRARARGWMDEFVASRYAPRPDELIELVEVFRARAAELADNRTDRRGATSG
jgi:hypothetical protein